jgi:hypothetical protein
MHWLGKMVKEDPEARSVQRRRVHNRQWWHHCHGAHCASGKSYTAKQLLLLIGNEPGKSRREWLIRLFR